MPPFRLFLRTPEPGRRATAVYREERAYGPGRTGFSPQWLISVDPAWPAGLEILAVSDGLVSVQAAGPDRLTLALAPLPLAVLRMAEAFGSALELPVAFRYHHVDAATLPAFVDRFLQRAPNPDGLSPTRRLDRFLAGLDSVPVSAGDPIGLLADGPDGGRPLAGFEVELPGGNRLDPVVFFRHLPLARYERRRGVLAVASRRVLAEVRTEHNTPYSGPVEVSRGNRPPTVRLIRPEDRGHLELPAGRRPWRLGVPGHRLTELPAGRHALAAVERRLRAPAQWTLQAVNPAAWLAPALPPHPEEYALQPFTEGNRVTALIDGVDTFEAMWQEYRRVLEPDHFVCLAAWWMQDGFPLIPGDPSSTFLALSRQFDRLGARIRALIWAPAEIPAYLLGQPLWDWVWPNPEVVRRINHLHHGRAILDSRTVCCPVPRENAGPLYSLAAHLANLVGSVVNVGSHHQKFTVIHNAEGLVAFCGGMDMERSRLQLPGHYFPPKFFDPCCEELGYHDVHCKVEGQAALDLLNTFRHRWNDHPKRPPGDTLAGEPRLRSPDSSHFVQVARTYPAGVGYAFAPHGERTLKAVVERAIRRARRYVYIEDQYLVFPAVRDALLDVLGRIEHLTILIPRDSDLPQDKYRRKQFIAPLKESGGSKVRVFWLRNHRKEPVYVHSKLIIIDDVFVTIGSANLTRRGFTHDSEVLLAVLDGEVERTGRRFARDLRMRLWAEHLGFYNPFTHRYLHMPLLDDPVSSAELWLRKSPLSLAVPYDENAGADVLSEEFAQGLWELLWDPDGSLAG